MDELNLKQGELDILMGGPPCQGFSSHRLKDAGVDDPRLNVTLSFFVTITNIAQCVNGSLSSYLQWCTR